MLKILSKFEYVLNGTLLFMLAFVVLLATIDLGWIIVKDILTPPLFLLEVDSNSSNSSEPSCLFGSSSILL